MFPELTTERLILRAFPEEDLGAFAAYRSDPEVARYQSWETPYTAEQAADFLAGVRSAAPGTPGVWYQVALECRATGELAGDCAFCVGAEDPRQAEIGFTLRWEIQGRGLATEAVTRLLGYLFEERGLHRVTARCDVENGASARLLEQVGMRREGHTLAAAWFKGRWCSEYWYALLRDEWTAGRRRDDATPVYR